MRTKQEPGSRELDYRLSKWILKNVEQLLTPDEVEKIWTELLSHYSPPTASIENVCGFTGRAARCPARTPGVASWYAGSVASHFGY